jgi:hypothetical protein
MPTIASIGTTPAGTAYTTYTDSVDGNGMRWSVSDTSAGGSNLRWLLYGHGAGGLDTELHNSTGLRPLRDFALDLGAVIMECYGGPSQSLGKFHWGRSFMRTAYRDLFDTVSAQHDLGEQGLIVGTSMGRTATNWTFFYDDLISTKAAALVDIVGVWDFLAEFRNPTNPNHFGLAGYYGLPSTASDAEFLAATDTHNPRSTPAELIAGKTVYVYVAGGDQTANPSWHGQVFWDTYSNVLTPASQFERREGATHGSTPDTVRLVRFAADVWEISPPGPGDGTLYRAINVYRRGASTRRYPITIR